MLLWTESCACAVNTLNSGSGGAGSSRLTVGVVSLDKELYSTLFLFIQVYKWVLAT